ncbi:MAG: ROK family protein [Anaerolineae bacterium]|nr:ROK family protein [Anaerolineae bacterium]MDQ7034930.1 ROK family protein [Anaerolineae bacterium]
MITRPHLITERFVAATRNPANEESVVAIDIGGTKIAGGIIGHHGEILIESRVLTPKEGGNLILDSASGLIADLLKRHEGQKPSAIGISTGGQIDRDGMIIGATDMLADWIDLPFKQSIAEKFRLPVTVINDGHAAALAEAHYGAGQGYESMLCIVIIGFVNFASGPMRTAFVAIQPHLHIFTRCVMMKHP